MGTDKNDKEFDGTNHESEIDTGSLNNDTEVNLDSERLNATEGENDVSTKSPKSKDSPILLGQGGYGTSGTSGSNAGGKQGYQSGLGSAGSQNSSTGFNAGSQGVDHAKSV